MIDLSDVTTGIIQYGDGRGMACDKPERPSSLDHIKLEGGGLRARDCVRNAAACRVCLDLEDRRDRGDWSGHHDLFPPERVLYDCRPGPVIIPSATSDRRLGIVDDETGAGGYQGTRSCKFGPLRAGRLTSLDQVAYEAIRNDQAAGNHHYDHLI